MIFLTKKINSLSFLPYGSSDSEYKSLERKLNSSKKEELKEDLKSSFDRAKNCSPHLSASLVTKIEPASRQV